MVKVALLVVALFLCLSPARGAAAPIPAGCLPGQYPTTPEPPVLSQVIRYLGERVRVDVWRQACVNGAGTVVYARATPVTIAPWFCGVAFSAIQGGAQFDDVRASTPINNLFCTDNLVVPVTVAISVDAATFNDQLAFQLLYRGYDSESGDPWGYDFIDIFFTFDIPAAPAPPSLATLAGAAVLPSSRAIQVGQPATALALIQAAPGNTAIGCSIAPTNAPAGTTFTYQETNAANVPIGTPNTPVDIPGGEFRTFVIALTPSQPFVATDITFAYDCTNTSPAPDTPGVNRLLLTSSAGPTPDIIANAVAVGGIVSMPVGGTGALAVATSNVAASAPIVVTADTGGTPLPLELTLCQTNPQTAQCINPTTPATSVTTQINAGETPTYTVFGKATGPIAFNPGLHRINVRYKTQAGGTVGSTSVAVQTQ